jgi:hypothetical protein
MTDVEPRNLTASERGLLDFILAKAKFPGASALAAQVASAIVVGGLPTLLDLQVMGEVGRADLPDGPIPMRAIVVAPDGEPEGGILVWVTGGYLSAIEFAWYTDETPSELPGADRIRMA